MPPTKSDTGQELVLLSGIEPHYRWRHFTDLLVEVAEHTGAHVVVTLGAMPAQVPPQPVPIVHASSANTEIAQRFGLARPSYQGITGIVGTLQSTLDHLGLPTISMQVGVPYYTAGAHNWKASAALLRNLEHVTGIPTGHGLLHEQVTEWEQLVDDAVAENPEASGYLPQLEAEYDRQASEQLPTSDDLAADFERYLPRARRPAELTGVAHPCRRHRVGGDDDVGRGGHGGRGGRRAARAARRLTPAATEASSSATVPATRDLEQQTSCGANRGTPTAPMFQFNHWVTPAEPVTARRVNSSIVRGRLRRCTVERGRSPTLIAVDFAEQGDVLGVVDRLNR